MQKGAKSKPLVTLILSFLHVNKNTLKQQHSSLQAPKVHIQLNTCTFICFIYTACIWAYLIDLWVLHPKLTLLFWMWGQTNLHGCVKIERWHIIVIITHLLHFVAGQSTENTASLCKLLTSHTPALHLCRNSVGQLCSWSSAEELQNRVGLKEKGKGGRQDKNKLLLS